jgi:hypothetical protein
MKVLIIQVRRFQSMSRDRWLCSLFSFLGYLGTIDEDQKYKAKIIYGPYKTNWQVKVNEKSTYLYVFPF